jgi:hypothetical protein
MGKIYGENLRGKLMGKIYGENYICCTSCLALLPWPNCPCLAAPA